MPVHLIINERATDAVPGKSIFDYAPHCNGAEDYAALAREVMGEALTPPVPTVLSARVELDERGSVSVLSVGRESEVEEVGTRG